ncbi:hypothetical protein HF319_09450 [Xanthomonas sp. Kuri4-1]
MTSAGSASLDSLLEVLDQAFLQAQRHCRERHEALLLAALERGDMQVRCVSPGGGEHALSMPVWQLQALRLPQVGGFSLALEVQVEACETAGGDPGLALVLAPRGGRAPRHVLKIEYTGSESPRGALWLDGVALRDWALPGRHAAPPGSGQTT